MNCLTQSSVFATVYPGDCLLSKFILQWQLTQTLEVVRHLALWGKRSCSAAEWKLWLACMILFDNMKHALAACNVKASDFVGMSSAMAALCDPLGLDPNPMPFFFDSTMEKKIAHGRRCRNLPALHQGARCGAEKWWSLGSAWSKRCVLLYRRRGFTFKSTSWLPFLVPTNIF